MKGGRGDGDATENVLVPFAKPRTELGVVTRVRSTLIVSSLRAVKQRNREADYLASLPQELHTEILTLVAGVWIPVETAMAHYQACESLALPIAEQQVIGNEVGDRIHGTFLGTMARMASGAGATPWNALAQCGRLYDRTFDGGGVCVTRAGPKEAVAEFAGMPLARFAYFRSGLRGMFQRGVELFARRAYATELPKLCTSHTVGVRISWV